MSRTVLLVGLLTLLGCEGRPALHDAILGKWRSNEQLTLESINATEKMTPESRAFLSDDFFGYLVVEFRVDESRTTHEKDDYDSGFEPYEVLEVADDYIRIKAWSNFFQNYGERILFLEGNCYYEIFKEFGFRTYFCKYG